MENVEKGRSVATARVGRRRPGCERASAIIRLTPSLP